MVTHRSLRQLPSCIAELTFRDSGDHLTLDSRQPSPRGAHAADRARWRSSSQPVSCAARWRGAEGTQNSEDRVSFSGYSTRRREFCRGIQAGVAGAWLRRRENVRPGASLRRGQTRTTSGARPGAGAPQGGRDRGEQRCDDCRGQTRDSDDPDRDGVQYGSGRNRLRGESRAPRRKCHRTQQCLGGTQWGAPGAPQGSRPRALPRSAPLESRRPGPPARLQGNGGGRPLMRLELQSVEVARVEDLDQVMSAVTSRRAQVLVVLPANPLFVSNRGQIASFAQKNRLPSMSGAKEYVDAGGLMSYGPSTPAMHRRAATYVDKILKGAKPADLPVEQPTKFELVINLKTA